MMWLLIACGVLWACAAMATWVAGTGNDKPELRFLLLSLILWWCILPVIITDMARYNWR